MSYIRKFDSSMTTLTLLFTYSMNQYARAGFIKKKKIRARGMKKGIQTEI